ncbi:hypothetical protein BOTBODRAFT_53899 [Botryobasidium botryosum FD-172 SS1]|uniref:FAD/NAD(P)-binding domain-containing protein n=1 Tax=Botryobasidium botryosum (strain FD-172 SS1) TaxID=930990 RepID=A0A067MZB8_BOTB1|nr:hypothetical protein BOTBODRAFT_53899 [Botryobasidium botryosum FD-172 SS1]
MLLSTQSSTDPSTIAQSWLSALTGALRSQDVSSALSLFGKECSWKDLFTFSWDIHSMVGPDAIRKYLDDDAQMGCSQLYSMKLRGPAKFDTFLDDKTVIFSFFDFETRTTRGQGVLRLAQESESGKWLGLTLYTGIEELKGHEEKIIAPLVGDAQPVVDNKPRAAYQHGPDTYADHDPEVLIIGAGQCGLSIAARLDRLDVKTLVIEKSACAGDSWRKRYDALILHDPVWVDHLPYLPFPDDWPALMPRAMLADWLEAYAKALQINMWTSTTLEQPSYNEATGDWTVELIRPDGRRRVMHPKHLIVCTGMFGEPRIPDFEGFDRFQGPVMHSSQFKNGKEFGGKKVVVVGACNSAMDISLDLQQNGADVTIVQRSSTYIMSTKGSMDIIFGKDRLVPPEVADLMKFSLPLSVATARSVAFTSELREYDAEMLAGLERAGYKVDFGYGDAGFYLKVLFRGGGYYFDIGCCQAIIDGHIKVKQGQEIDHFEEDGVVFADGDKVKADAIVCATGYSGLTPAVRPLLGDKIMERVGTVGTVDDEGERKGAWRLTGHPGLWFHIGNIQLCRFFSKRLALQVKAELVGLQSESQRIRSRL